LRPGGDIPVELLAALLGLRDEVSLVLVKTVDRAGAADLWVVDVDVPDQLGAGIAAADHDLRAGQMGVNPVRAAACSGAVLRSPANGDRMERPPRATVVIIM